MNDTDTSTLPANTTRDVFDPAAVQRLDPAFDGAPVYVWRYTNGETRWRLSIATNAEPGSGMLSLGGFRIAPWSRTNLPGFDSDREAVGLAIGMEEKVYWSRLLHVGGPLAREARGRVVGGKCVLHPTPDARVGQPRDRALLDWAIACFRDFEAASGVFLTTGQDLGHGLMSDGRTSSLDYLNERFKGSVRADTSIPTAVGNFHVLAGMLAGAGIDLATATVGLIGVGHIGRHMLGTLRDRGATVLACEINPETRADLKSQDIATWANEAKQDFLGQPMHAVVVNAAGGSLDLATCERIAANDTVRVVCGSENLAMPDPRGVDVLLAGHVAYAPTELGGMMGYLTAVEEYLARRAGQPFEIAAVTEAASRLEGVSRAAMEAVVASGWQVSFEEAVRGL